MACPLSTAFYSFGRDMLKVFKGFKNAKIADPLSISEGTVKNHLKNIFAKMGVERQVVQFPNRRYHGRNQFHLFLHQIRVIS